MWLKAEFDQNDVFSTFLDRFRRREFLRTILFRVFGKSSGQEISSLLIR
jgi:hypothetical protein